MTNIQWTDVTDNIIAEENSGWWCRKISEGCNNCYAEALNQNGFFGGNKLPYSGTPPELKLQRHILESWSRQRKPKKHFVSSMTDVFGEWVPREWHFEMLEAMCQAPNQTFQVLTKRPKVMLDATNQWLERTGRDELPENIWCGVSVENQRVADWRIPVLLKVRSRVRFLSCEPLLEHIDLQFAEFFDGVGETSCINWVILGGESGKNARTCHVDWMASIVRQCQEAEVAVFVKQLGSNPKIIKFAAAVRVPIVHKKGGDFSEFPSYLQLREFPHA